MKSFLIVSTQYWGDIYSESTNHSVEAETIEDAVIKVIESGYSEEHIEMVYEINNSVYWPNCGRPRKKDGTWLDNLNDGATLVLEEEK